MRDPASSTPFLTIHTCCIELELEYMVHCTLYIVHCILILTISQIRWIQRRALLIIAHCLYHHHHHPHHLHQIDPTHRAFRCKIGTESKSTGDGNATASIFLEVRFNSKLMHIYTYICTMYMHSMFIHKQQKI